MRYNWRDMFLKGNFSSNKGNSGLLALSSNKGNFLALSSNKGNSGLPQYFFRCHSNKVNFVGGDVIK